LVKLTITDRFRILQAGESSVLGPGDGSPFEAAPGCDVVRMVKEYPDLLIHGGFDKRILDYAL
jgi:hypothetical protein